MPKLSQIEPARVGLKIPIRVYLGNDALFVFAAAPNDLQSAPRERVGKGPPFIRPPQFERRARADVQHTIGGSRGVERPKWWLRPVARCIGSWNGPWRQLRDHVAPGGGGIGVRYQ